MDEDAETAPTIDPPPPIVTAAMGMMENPLAKRKVQPTCKDGPDMRPSRQLMKEAIKTACAFKVRHIDA